MDAKPPFILTFSPGSPESPCKVQTVKSTLVFGVLSFGQNFILNTVGLIGTENIGLKPRNICSTLNNTYHKQWYIIMLWQCLHYTYLHRHSW